MSSVSVIIPTLNGEKTLSHLLEGLMSQTRKPSEIVVVDSSSEDSTVQILREFGIEPVVIDRGKFNHGSTRNMAASMASGEILVFMTQDAIPADNEMIERLTDPLKEENIGCAYGRHIPCDDASSVEKFSRMFNYPPESMVKGADDIQRLGIKTFFFSNVCSAIKRSVFNEVGGFDRVIMNEDMLIAAKVVNAGYKIAYQAMARVIHSHNYTPVEQFRRYYDISRSIKGHDMLKYVVAEREGRRFLKGGIKFCLENGGLVAVVSLFLDVMFRYLGYQAGKRAENMPGSFSRYMSMYGGSE